jgi:hypothetical protein
MKKKASGKAAARKPTGKAVGRKSNIDTAEVIDPRAKKTVDACIQLQRTAKKRAARIADGDISEAEMEFLAERTPQRQHELPAAGMSALDVGTSVLRLLEQTAANKEGSAWTFWPHGGGGGGF